MKLALLAWLGLLALLQDAPADLAARAARQEHVRALRAERTAALLQAWLAAGAEAGATTARAAARAALEAAHPRGAPAGAAPTLQALDTARRALEDPAADAERRALGELVDALDVRVAPGAFAPAAAGLGQPLTVHIATLWKVSAPREVDVELAWIAPDGERTPARREPVGGRAFSAQGFEMYVRAPLSDAADGSGSGVWHLALEATSGGETVAAVRVPVVCAVAPPAASPDDAVSAFVEERFEALIEGGWRSALPPGLAEPAGLAYDEPRGAEWAWILRAEDEPRCAIVLLTPPEEAAEAVLAEPLGPRWRAVGAELEARIVSARLPYPLGSSGRPDLARFVRELPGLRDLGMRVPIYLVARGMASAHLVTALSGPASRVPDALEGFVLTALAPKRRADDGPAAFGVLVVGGPPPDPTATTLGVDHVASEDPPVLTDLELPRIVRDWIANSARAAEGAPPEDAGGR